MSVEAEKPNLTIQQVMQYLPHRYPFLLIDRIDEYVDTKTARGIKQLSINEEFFQGHFPDRPHMPTSLLIEAMAQVGAATIMTAPENADRYILFAALDNAEFGRSPVPGERLDIEATMINYRKEMGRTRIVCKVGDEQVASADYVFAVSDLAP